MISTQAMRNPLFTVQYLKSNYEIDLFWFHNTSIIEDIVQVEHKSLDDTVGNMPEVLEAPNIERKETRQKYK